MPEQRRQGFLVVLFAATKWWLLAAAIVLTAGCSAPDDDTPFDNYLQRLSRVLGVEVKEPLPPLPLRPPRSGKLQLSVAQSKIDALDFLALTGCELQVTIGKRNSSLGRMARPSQRLLLELEFLRLAPACIKHLREDNRTTLADTLESAWQDKQKLLPTLIFNATLGGDEFRAFWQHQRAPGTYPPVGNHSSIDALTQINAQVKLWLSGSYAADNLNFELQLGAISGGPGGSLLQQLKHQQGWLQAANAMLEERGERGTLCGENLRHAAADNLPNVVQRYFVAGIQPRAAKLEQQRYAFLPPIEALEKQLSAVTPPIYEQWRNNRDEQFASAAAAPRQHVASVQKLLAPCQRQNGANNQAPFPQR